MGFQKTDMKSRFEKIDFLPQVKDFLPQAQSLLRIQKKDLVLPRI
jgi:hypothetical protein